MKLLEVAIYTVIILIPTYLIRVDLGVLRTNLLDLLIIGMLLLWVIKERGKVALPSLPKPLAAALILVGAGVVIGIVAHPSSASLGAAKSWFVLPLLFAFVVCQSMRTKKSQEGLLYALIVSATLTALYSLAWGREAYDGRLQGFYGSPNILAMYIAPGFLACVLMGSEYWSTWDKNKKMVAVCSLALLAYALLASVSLGSIGGVIVSLSCVLFFSVQSQKNPQLWNKLWITMLTCVLLVNVALGASALLLDAWEMGRTSFAARLIIWQVSLAMLADHGLWGLGVGNFQDVYLSYQNNYPPFLEWAVPHPHNILLATWLWAGIMGIAGYMLLWWWAVTRSGKDQSSLVVRVALAIMAYAILHGLWDNTLWRNDAAVIFWLCIALLVYRADIRTNRPPGRVNA